MLLSKTTSVTWNSRIKQHYVLLGYKFTGMNQTFLVNIQDLTSGSNAEVNYTCDYCGKELSCSWRTYNTKRKIIAKDCCASAECNKQKSRESLVERFGTYKINTIKDISAKRISTNLQKYGSPNPFSSEIIKEKIKKTVKEKYGVEFVQQNERVKEKRQSTCLTKYGVKDYVELFKGKFIKENSPTWKGGFKISCRHRENYEYQNWRANVFLRDKYTCQCCKNPLKRNLEAHHIFNWKTHVDLRYDINNGVTMCKECHKKFHKKYTKFNNDSKQLVEFLKDEKIC